MAAAGPADMAGARRTFTVKTEVAGLNLREEPTTESRILRLIPNGEKVTIDPAAEVPEGWCAVKDGGYVMKQYLV